jgi:hypothetical protein
VNFGAQEFGEVISRLQGISENANMLCRDMQPNAFQFGKILLLQKVGVTMGAGAGGCKREN